MIGLMCLMCVIYVIFAVSVYTCVESCDFKMMSWDVMKLKCQEGLPCADVKFKYTDEMSSASWGDANLGYDILYDVKYHPPLCCPGSDWEGSGFNTHR